VTPDTDKLIRQLSLVAYLMSERRSASARDVKQAVEGYSDMSDEAFARRFYADRTELLGLGVPISSQRDEFTGEELYTLRREQYFLPPLHLSDDELAALSNAVYLLEGQFAYAEPLRLALQNLALGRPNPSEDAGRDVTLSLTGSGYTSDVAARLQKLEAAVSKQRTVLFRYWSISTDEEAQRTLDPYSLYSREGQWYVVGHDRDRDAIRTFRLTRIRGDVRFATRRERDFRTPSEFDATAWRDRVPWALSEGGETAVIWVAPDDAWQLERSVGRHGTLEFQDDRSALYTTQYSDSRALLQWMLDRNGRVVPLSPPELREEMASGLERVRELHEGPPPAHAAPIRMVRESTPPPEKVESPVAPERFAVLQAMMAQLLAACGEQSRTKIAAKDLKDRFHLDDEGLDRHLQLLNLVNFGGGCYALYAELQDDGETIDVEKELYGDEFRRPARLSPLEAKALLLALDLVGPLVAADAHTSLPAVRAKVEEAFGQYETRDVAVPPASAVDEDVLSLLQDAIRLRRLVEIEYLKRVGDVVEKRLVEPHRLRGLRGEWLCDTWDRTAGGERTFRVDRIRSAEMLEETFERRLGERAGDQELTGNVGQASVWFSPRFARWELEKRDDTAELADGAAVATITYSAERFLANDLCRHLGEAILLEPERLRPLVAARATELLALLRQHAEAHAARS
jgi:proteasome accessory factor C